ncbi:MAG TPA: site-2 protease family protein [Anaeromyxobacter sp.]|nr:site-2 protease family protein [Anaeromyxobacter sp.]
MPGFDLRSGLMMLIPLVLSLTVHEFAHAWSARRLGDDTASRMGRMTLNPLAHIDPIGTLLLPLLGIPFGWAKPVPVNPARFRPGVRMGTGMALTAAAGPASNILLALLLSATFAALERYIPGWLAQGRGIGELLEIMIVLNVNLALFNLLPIPPLDGSRIVDGFMPQGLRPIWDRLMMLSPLLLLVVFFFAGRIIAGPSRYVLGLLERFISALSA